MVTCFVYESMEFPAWPESSTTTNADAIQVRSVLVAKTAMRIFGKICVIGK